MGDISWEEGEIQKLGTPESPYYRLRKALRTYQARKRAKKLREAALAVGVEAIGVESAKPEVRSEAIKQPRKPEKAKAATAISKTSSN